MQGNFVKIASAEAFGRGRCEGLSPADTGRGALMLDEGRSEGTFVSPVFRTEPWNDLVASWNSDTPRGTSIEVFGRARLSGYEGRSGGRAACDGWTDWITWGEWSPYIRRNCPDARDTHPRPDGRAGDRAYGFSYSGWGDSSLNIAEGLLAEAFQLKAVLRADGTQQAQPALRLLAASFKNTDDPDWQQKRSLVGDRVREPASVLLETPAISQMRRDPSYADSICSATCMTMQLDFCGEELLPEELALMNYDYGFGGNGNWSFTTAAGGAFGHECFVHYTSFEGLRQELAKGWPVTLSVKYSDRPDGKYPYLQNAPTSTGGHLIVIVGYRYDGDLGEYVYYANDPAARSDRETARRQYRGTQLSEAWYRRAAYFVHGREEGAGRYGQERREALLWPVNGEAGTYDLISEDNERLVIPFDFTSSPREDFGGHGSIFVVFEGEGGGAGLPEDIKKVSANDPPHFDKVRVTGNGSLRFSEDVTAAASAGSRRPVVYVISNDAVTCRAVFAGPGGSRRPARKP